MRCGLAVGGGRGASYTRDAATGAEFFAAPNSPESGNKRDPTSEEKTVSHQQWRDAIEHAGSVIATWPLSQRVWEDFLDYFVTVSSRFFSVLSFCSCGVSCLIKMFASVVSLVFLIRASTAFDRVRM